MAMTTDNDPTLSANQTTNWTRVLEKIPVIGDWMSPKDKIAVIRMSGIIADTAHRRRSGISYKKYDEAMDQAFDIPKVKAVALIINSPGGAPAQCSLIANKIRRLAQEKEVPVLAFVQDVAASGGYWLACIADDIYAQETSIIGSIGVISSGFGLDDFIKRHDIKRRIYTAGNQKSFLDPFRPEKSDDLQRLQSVLDDMHESFKDWVKSRRENRLKSDDKTLMEGAFWTGKQAFDLGLIDGFGDVEQVLKDRLGDDIRFIDCSPERKTLFSSILPFGGDSMGDWGAVFDAAEEKSFWARFGL
jgi:signal peptide peptidase SppA